MVELLIARGRDLGDLSKKGLWKGKDCTALEIARERVLEQSASGLTSNWLHEEPDSVRRKLQEKLHLPGPQASEYFALVVFLCDGLFQFNPEAHTTSTRFFAIAQRLPMELQMILCHRILDSNRTLSWLSILKLHLKTWQGFFCFLSLE